MSGYNYDSFAPDKCDLQSSDGPEVGQQAPDFELLTHDGHERRRLEFPGECLVLELGSMTCPLFLTRSEGMHQISKDFPQVTCVVMYVREAHPGAAIPAHKDLEGKRACARLLKDDLHDPRTILVDGVEGLAHQAYGSMPNAAYVIDKGGVVRFKAPWSNPKVTRKAIEAVFRGEDVRAKNYFKPAKPSIVISTIRRAGKGSGVDWFRGLPRLIWNVLIRNNLRVLFRSK